MRRAAGFLVALLAAAGGGTAVVDLDGAAVDPFADKDAVATVLVFLRDDCPISNRVAPELQRIASRFEPLGVAFWMVYPDPRTSAEAIRTHRRDYGHPGRAIRDPAFELVRRAGATITPETAVFAPDGRLVYRGRVDDRFADFGKARAVASRHDLEEALAALARGKNPPTRTTRAVGCYLSDIAPPGWGAAEPSR